MAVDRRFWGLVLLVRLWVCGHAQGGVLRAVRACGFFLDVYKRQVLRAVRACGLWRWIGGCGGWCCLWVRHYDGV
ncbi:hypothetical protein [Bartonella krasnovii]|uniref:hypothetical protein n=1 Tax=Bartonella krasnovii TaxID=2267275 RepID=UPI001F4C95B3|nr:hypothetical protein [Bartonella krasnovii]UNF38528.1 hypothetical protein MNL10_07315 [Bartonella krasnovii]